MFHKDNKYHLNTKEKIYVFLILFHGTVNQIYRVVYTGNGL